VRRSNFIAFARRNEHFANHAFQESMELLVGAAQASGLSGVGFHRRGRLCYIQTVLVMRKIHFVLSLLCAVLCLGASAADTNVLVWHKAADRVDADIHGEPLWPLLEDIARQTGWHIFVEPGATRNASAKFSDLPSGDALRMLLGKLNFALVPETNGPLRLYVFTTRMENATQPVRVPRAPARHVPNELLVKVKPGTDMDALAKLLGAKITGRNDKLGIYRLQFSDADSTDAALGQLKNNSDATAVDYNYIYDAPPAAQQIANASIGPVSLTLNPSGDSGKVIVGLIDTPVQSLDSSLEQFLLKELSVVDGTSAGGSDPTHGTAMAETILRALAAASGGSTSAQILPVDVYGASENTTSWNVALGIQAAVDNGATVLNLSLGGAGDSSVLDSVIQQAIALGIPVFAAAGNDSSSQPTYPAAVTGVIAVTATQGSELASYANYGSDVEIALSGTSIFYLNGTAYLVQGTSVSTAYAAGAAAGNKTSTTLTWAQIVAAMEKKFPVPQK
jgi:thermitase